VPSGGGAVSAAPAAGGGGAPAGDTETKEEKKEEEKVCVLIFFTLSICLILISRLFRKSLMMIWALVCSIRIRLYRCNVIIHPPHVLRCVSVSV
jgi:hypothetical protein